MTPGRPAGYEDSVRVLILSCFLLVTACTESSNTVNIYNWSDYIGETTLEDFTEASGIETRYDVYDSNDVLEAKLLAGGSGYDVVVPASEPYFAREIEAGIYQKLDKSKLPNLQYLDPDLMGKAAASDPGNEHGVIYQYGTTGFGYNVDKLDERMPGAPVDSLDMLFEPDIVARFADCGVTMLDTANEVIPLALNYLGKDPNGENAADLEAAEELLISVRPYIKYFHSSQYINDLASGEICLALGWSGDVVQARMRSAEAQNPQRIAYTIPKEGTILWFDMLAIPKDAPHPDAALAFINFVLDPKVMAGITNYVAYANAVPESLQFVREDIRNDTTIFPTPDIRSRLFVQRVLPADAERERNRAWTRIKSGR
jgi:putrescine transport system substrate-binding protein